MVVVCWSRSGMRHLKQQKLEKYTKEAVGESWQPHVTYEIVADELSWPFMELTSATIAVWAVYRSFCCKHSLFSEFFFEKYANEFNRRMSATKCYLKCTENSHEPLVLADGVEVSFGRGPDTKIKDSRCSRCQIKLKADYSKKTVKVTQVGRNACGLNGLALKKDSSVTAKHGDRVEILLGQFIHVIEFESPPKETDKGKASKNKEKATPSLESTEVLDDDSSNTEEGEDSPPRGPAAKRSRLQESEHWESVDNGKLLIYSPPGLKTSNLIAAYDLDGTIIGTLSGSVFPKHKNDWKILYREVLGKLKEMHENNYKILIFTNQASLSSGKQNVNDFKKKVEDIIKKINLPIQVFIASGYSIYRKPAIGMWEAAMERNQNLKIDMAKSFYCGDAAGREAGEYVAKKDFSHTDLLFAKNLELNFETPEHHFLKKKMGPLKVTVFDPKAIPCDVPLCEPSWGQVISNKLEVIILVGSPGSGKTHFAKTHLLPAGYVHVNRDTLGSWTKCANAMNHALTMKQKVVVDNTNPDVESRKRFIDLAKNYTHIVRCFVMKTSLQHAKHNNKFRQLTDPAHAVGDVVLNTFMSKFQEPKLTEGFTEILKINFWLTFKNPEHEKLYRLFLLEK